MNTIVLNTLNGAVTEYSDLGFDSITQDHAGSANGLLHLSGTTDNGLPIASVVETGKGFLGDIKKKTPDIVFVGVKAVGANMRLTVLGETGAWSYGMAVLAGGVSRCVPGRGIRENYLAFRLENPQGEDFTLDFIQVPTKASDTRRTK